MRITRARGPLQEAATAFRLDAMTEKQRAMVKQASDEAHEAQMAADKARAKELAQMKRQAQAVTENHLF